MKFKVMSYNIQHGRDHRLPGNVIDFDNTVVPILTEDPAVVALNEVRNGRTEDYVDQAAALASLCGGTPIFGKAHSLGENKDYGNAVISKLPVLFSETIAIPNPEVRKFDGHYEPRAILRTQIDFGGTTVTVLAVHVGLNPDEQENAISVLVDIIQRETDPVILMGDFNMEPDNEILNPLRGVISDTAEVLDSREFTFSSGNPCKTIDYIWYKGITPLRIYPVKEIHSDHFPLVAEFDI